MSSSGPLKCFCEATGFQKNQIQSVEDCRKGSSMQFNLRYWKRRRKSSSAGKSIVCINFGYWQLFDCVRWSYFYSFEIFFLGFLSRNFKCVGAFSYQLGLGWYFVKLTELPFSPGISIEHLHTFQRAYIWVLHQWYGRKILLYCILGSYYHKK